MVQFLAAALGAASTGLADWLHQRGRIGRKLHSFWVSASIAVISLPVLDWISVVFLGSGLLSQVVAGALVGAIFFWVNGNLRKLPSIAPFGPHRASARPASGPVPPASKLNN
jgi:hypothetical protein